MLIDTGNFLLGERFILYLVREENKEKDFLSIQGENLVKLSLGPTKKRWGKNGRRSNEKSYTEWSLTKLTVLSTFDNWEKLSKPRHLAYSAGKVYVTDRGLHKVVELNFY